MDVLDDPGIYKAVYMLGVQLGKTEVLLNRVGKNIHLNPGPMLFAFPDDESLREFSKDRVLPMIEACKPLREKIIEKKKNISKESTIKSKRFHGGYFAMVSARTEKSFMSRAIRDLFMDEVDRYQASSGREGDPIGLAEKRTTNYSSSRKIAIASSPGNEGESHIAPAYEKSDKRKWYCPCPHCDHKFVILWEHVQWDKEKGPNGQTIHKPETARLVCHACGSLISELQRIQMVRAGEWIKHAPTQGVAGFWANSLMSLFTSLSIIVKEFIDAKDNPQELKVFTNTRLAETWTEPGQEVKSDRLYDRREEYPATVPNGAFVLTAGVDVQDDRLEITIDGWGIGEENWVIDHLVIWGEPKEPGIWAELDTLLSSTWTHETGVELSLSATCIDSAGHNTQMVYSYCEKREALRQFAIIGRDGEGRPAISAPSEKRTGSNPRPVKLFTVGVDGVKALIYSRLLANTEPGSGYIHFPIHFSEEYFKQLASEKAVKTYERGVKKTVWKQLRPRNEAFDCKVYSYAALKTLLPNWQEWRDRIIIPQDLPKPEEPRQRRIISKGIR